MASKTETAKAKAIADLLRQQLFIGVETTAAPPKLATGGQQPRFERLLNVVSVMERDSSRGSGPAKPRLLCITVKRNRKLRLHKAKLTNKTAEISKTWTMDDIKAIEFREPTRFSLHLNHKYDFTATDAVLVEGFVQMLVNFCNKYAVKPPRYINTVSGAAGATPAGSTGTIRPRTAYGRAAGGRAGGAPGIPAMPSLDLVRPSADGAASDAVTRPRTRARGQQRGPGDQNALMRRMTKYVADHGGDVSALVPMGAPPPDEVLGDEADGSDFGDEADDVEEMLLDEAFMLTADELTSDFGWRANVDAAQLEARLMSELHKIESDNVRDMLEADKQVPNLVKDLDQAIAALDMMDRMLKSYNIELEAMDDDVRKIQMENESLKIEEVNQQRLLDELDKILKTITLSEKELQVLRNESLETSDGIERVERVAASLKRMLGTTPGEGLGSLEATHEKLKKYEFYSSNFSTRVYDYLKVMFQFKITESTNERSRPARRGIRLVSGPDQVHKVTIKYAGLTLWLREAKPSADKELQALYIQCMNTLYSGQARELVDSCRSVFFRYRHDVNSGGPNPVAEFSFSASAGAQTSGVPGVSNRRLSLDGLSGAAHQALVSAVKGDTGSISGPAGGAAPGVDMQPAEAFAIALENLVSNVIAEQNFISDLFHYAPSAHTRAARRGRAEQQQQRAARDGSAEDGEAQARHSESVTFYNWVTYKMRPVERWDVPRAKLASDDVVSQTVHFGSVKEVKSMLDLLFGSLATQIDTLVEMGTRFDPSQAVGMMMPVEKALQVCKNSDQGFLINVLERCKDRLEAMFQRYVSEQASAIEATKFVTKKRVGALPFARIFPRFIAHIEDLVGDTGYSARSIADSAYGRISRLIFDTLETQLREADRNAHKNADDKDAQKEQLNAHVLLLENMFVLVGGLQTYKARGCPTYFVPTLETYIDHAHALQRKVTRAYMKDVLQRPMGKLIGFFEMVDRCVASKRDPLETSNLGKSHAKKVIQAHSGSVMRENIKQLYKRVDKHFINEPRLRPIIWQAITDDILSNYQRIVTLLARAYKSTNLSLDFTQTDLKRWLNER
ncbi:hypothetical protein H4R19_000849 [Coemansia spiralis]|nr:hypothetical protein H4R19_000849 [Coemansia spiralis]